VSQAVGRRTPRQERSRAKVDAILDAADELLVEQGPAGLGTTNVAERAGVAVGTLYQYFDSSSAILDALVARHAERYAVRLRAALAEEQFVRKRDAANAALDVMIDYYREAPGLGAAWQVAPGPTAAGFSDTAGQLTGLVVQALVDQGLVDASDADFEREVQINWVVADALIRLAFRREPEGDPVVLGHLRRLFGLEILR
jgi:AcrR family transcriptional regulator